LSSKCFKIKLLECANFGAIESIGQISDINNNPSFRQKHLGVPDGPVGSDGTAYPLLENYTLPIAYLPPVLCDWNVVMYMYHQNDTCVTLFTGAAVML
jgi:hypothetical protein